MKSHELLLTAGLTLALTSNALLMLLLLYRSYNGQACTNSCHHQQTDFPKQDPSFSDQFPQISGRLQEEVNNPSGVTLSYTQNPEQSSGKDEWANRRLVNQNGIRSSTEANRPLGKAINSRKRTFVYPKDEIHNEDNIKYLRQSTSLSPQMPNKKQDLINTDDHTILLDRLRKFMSSVDRDGDQNKIDAQKYDTPPTAPDLSEADTYNDDGTEFDSNTEISDSYLVVGNSSAHLWRNRRDVLEEPKVEITARVVDQPPHGLSEVFSTLTEKEREKFDAAVSDILFPALVHFEGMVIREVENIYTVMKSHDLRIEEIERTMLSLRISGSREPQADATDNKSELDNLRHVLGGNFLPVGNGSFLLEIDLNGDEGSGEVEWTTPTTTTTTTTTTTMSTTTESLAYQDLYRTITEVEQKVLALENYNAMSDSELTRVRSEVIKMDDKVTEMDRRQRNLRSRTSMHTYKITEMEMTLGKSEVGIHSALDAYSRVNSRLESFKERLTELATDLHGVTVHFHRQDQIANELRAADSYKAHDIQEIRKTIFGLESRLNGIYRVIDENVENARSDLRNMIVRLCFDNKLIC